MIKYFRNLFVPADTSKNKPVDKILHHIMVDMVEYNIKELTKVHGVDMNIVLGDNFIRSLKNKDIDAVRLANVYFTIIRPMVKLKRQQKLIS